MTDSACAPPIAVDLLTAGRFQDALAPLRLAVSLGDSAPSTLLNLAIAEDRAGDRIRAQRLMRHVALCLPDWDEPVLRIAESYRSAGENALAEAAYEDVLRLNPDRPEALIAFGGLLLMRHEGEAARAKLQHACDIAPDNAEAWNTFGQSLHATGAVDLALAAFLKAQSLDGDNLEYVLNGIAAADEIGGAEAELVRLQAACDTSPLNLALQVGHGMLLERMGRREEAIDVLEAATVMFPDALEPLRMLGGILVRSTHVRQAEPVLRRVIALDPDNFTAANEYAVVLTRLHRHGEARAVLLDVRERQGPNTNVVSNLANATVYVGMQSEAVDIARQAVEFDPAAVAPWRSLCNALAYRDGTTGAELLSAMRKCSDVLGRVAQPRFENVPDPDRPLVVGLLSGTFRTHPVGWLTVAGLESLDRDQFSLICLAQNAASDDAFDRRYRAASCEWIDIDALSDAALNALARSKRIDVLIDLGGYGDAGRMPACANRLAPVQIKWVGMQAHSTGMPEMDWFLTDRWETPDGFEALYSEKLLRLRDGYVCYSPPPNVPDVVALPALANGYITFGCFNNLAKITPRVMATWASIMRRVPRSRLILKTHQLSEPPIVERVRADFAALDIASDRLELRCGSSHRAFMGEYGHVDFVLDPFPYSGGLTTCEALWMGVPTLALAGEIFAARHSASHMSNAGLADWVTGSVEDYIEMAVARANDPNALAALRAGLRDTVRRSPLCDAPRFGHSLGAALRHAWREWCNGQSSRIA